MPDDRPSLPSRPELSAHPDLPPDFAALHPDERSRFLTAMREMTQLAFRHAVGIVVGPPPSIGGEVRSASGSMFTLPCGDYLLTADHVVRAWERRATTRERVLFQVKDALIRPDEQVVWRDVSNDIAVLRLTMEQRRGIPVLPFDPGANWPPRPPVRSAYVLVSGFPEVIRQQPHGRAFHFNALSAMLQVTSVAEHHLVCQFGREHWIATDWHGVPAPGTDLSGMSGAPVLAVNNLVYPLVGVVSEFSPTFELLHVRTLSHLPVTFAALAR